MCDFQPRSRSSSWGHHLKCHERTKVLAAERLKPSEGSQGAPMLADLSDASVLLLKMGPNLRLGRCNLARPCHTVIALC